MFERVSQDRIAVEFSGVQAGTGPLTWGQKAIWQDMQASGNQFTMDGRAGLPPDSTVEDAAARLAGLMGRHAALRMRLGAGRDGRPHQEVAGAGEIGLDIVTIPDDADPADVTRYADDLRATQQLARFDFQRDWPLRMTLLRHRGGCRYLVWTLSHLAADGGGHLLFFDDLMTAGPGTPPRHPHVLDIARGEQEPGPRQLSRRAMRHWESALNRIPAQTFGPPARPRTEAAAGAAAAAEEEAGPRYWQARFSSPAAYLAMQVIAGRTGTDASRVTLAVIATAIARVTGAGPLTIKVMVNNRFRPGLADVIAPIAQNAVVTLDLNGASVNEAVARTRGALMTASMRAYYDPDELGELTARLDAARGHQASVTCRVNDQRAMIMRDGADGDPAGVTPERIRSRLGDTSLTWLGRRDNMHEQVNLLVENVPGVLSLHMMWDGWSLTDGAVEAILRAVEEVAVQAVCGAAAPTSRSR